MAVYRTFASISVVGFALFALSGSQASLRTDVALLVLGGLVVPALLVALGARLRTGGAETGMRELALADARDVMRMDSDKG